MMEDSKTLKFVNQTQFIYKNLAMLEPHGRKLMFTTNSKDEVKEDQAILNKPLNDDFEMKDEKIHKTQEFGALKMARLMLTG
jgi:hypothetical protein